MTDRLIAIRKSMGSCHVKEADLVQLAEDVQQGLGGDVIEHWEHGYAGTIALDKTQASEKQKTSTKGLLHVNVERRITASSWQDLATNVRAKQKGRRLEHLSVEFGSNGNKVTLNIGSVGSEPPHRAKFRVQVEAFGDPDRLTPVMSDVLRRLDRPRRRAELWAMYKHVTYLVLTITAVAILASLAFSRSADGGVYIDPPEKFVPIALGSAVIAVIPLTILVSLLSYASSARVIMKRDDAARKSRINVKGLYGNFVQALHDSWLVRPFTKDAPSGAVVLGLMGFPFGVLGFIVAVIALFK